MNIFKEGVHKDTRENQRRVQSKKKIVWLSTRKGNK